MQRYLLLFKTRYHDIKMRKVKKVKKANSGSDDFWYDTYIRNYTRRFFPLGLFQPFHREPRGFSGTKKKCGKGYNLTRKMISYIIKEDISLEDGSEGKQQSIE